MRHERSGENGVPVYPSSALHKQFSNGKNIPPIFTMLRKLPSCSYGHTQALSER